jgi:hypothetical protein
MKVQILLLANSKKLGGRCLAGLRTDTWEWVRPVTESEHGDVARKDCIVNGAPLMPLDVISLELGRHVPRKHQKENHLFDLQSIRREATAEVQAVSHFLDIATGQLPYLVTDPAVKVSPDIFDQAKEPQPSLALIKVESAKVQDVGQSSREISFTFQNRFWALKLTDDNFSPEAKNFELGPSYLCISLGELFEEKNAHWKFVAAAIPLR